jgi:effector-binding domain-containing protein
MMAYDVAVIEEAGRRLLAVERTATLKGLGPVFMESLDVVEGHLKSHNVRNTRHRVGFYKNVRTEDGQMTFDCVIGVEVPEGAPESDDVKLHTLPSGPAATAVFWGDYSGLHEAHEAIQQWCQANGRPFGDNWEVYGDWSDDPAKRCTDVFYELKP